MVTERLIATDYIIYKEKQSEIDPTKTLHLEVGYGCPRCRTASNHVLQHGEETKCKHCNLSITLWGNALECTA
jgi:DNA-directed RNA polymerase subunit RPC12/RpoP